MEGSEIINLQVDKRFPLVAEYTVGKIMLLVEKKDGLALTRFPLIIFLFL